MHRFYPTQSQTVPLEFYIPESSITPIGYKHHIFADVTVNSLAFTDESSEQK